MNTPQKTPLSRLVAAERHRQRGLLWLAGGSAAVVASASVLLLGLSGWFITGTALAGAGGAAAAWTFNTLLPSAAIRLLAILRTGCRYSERLLGHDAAFRALARIRPELYQALAATPPAQALGLSAGDAVGRMVMDVSEVEQRFVRGSAIWSACAGAIVGSALLLLAGRLALAAVMAVAAVGSIVAWLLAAAMAGRGRAVPPANGLLRQEFAVFAGAASELRAYGLEEWAAGRICARARIMLSAQQQVTAGAGWFELLLATVAGLAAMLALLLARGGPLPVAALSAFGAMMMVDAAGGYVRGLPRRGHLQAAEARLNAMLVRDVPLAIARPPIGAAPAIALPMLGMRFPVGSIVGIRGPSGCGKTVFIEQLARLRAVDRDRICLDGVEINDIDPEAARGCFSLAPQDAALLGGSLRDNLLLASPEATETDLWDALHDAVLDDRVRRLRHGLDSDLGEGARLSGGERRRLALARAYLRTAPWLLLDEPTEGLDRQTETIVIDRLQARLARSGQGAILVSHRQAPFALCGVVLDWQQSRRSRLVGSRRPQIFSPGGERS